MHIPGKSGGTSRACISIKGGARCCQIARSCWTTVPLVMPRESPTGGCPEGRFERFFGTASPGVRDQLYIVSPYAMTRMVDPTTPTGGSPAAKLITGFFSERLLKTLLLKSLSRCFLLRRRNGKKNGAGKEDCTSPGAPLQHVVLQSKRPSHLNLFYKRRSKN